MKRLYAFGTFVLFLATGCTPQPTPTLIMPSNFASTPKDYKHSIQNYFALKAPTKKVYDFKEPIKAINEKDLPMVVMFHGKDGLLMSKSMKIIWQNLI